MLFLLIAAIALLLVWRRRRLEKSLQGDASSETGILGSERDGRDAEGEGENVDVSAANETAPVVAAAAVGRKETYRRQEDAVGAPSSLSSAEDVDEKGEGPREPPYLGYTAGSSLESDTTTSAAPITSWTPEKVSASLRSAGVSEKIVDIFAERRIDGQRLLLMNEERLHEMGVEPFSARSFVVMAIDMLREHSDHATVLPQYS
ncbi:hypothetical protein HDU97_008863 [Phlyctochytrium planicorne]|nr:hypothetical protein HDU97_008863 [Phlyctochytrium planicorne]